MRALWKGLTPFATHLTLKYALRMVRRPHTPPAPTSPHDTPRHAVPPDAEAVACTVSHIARQHTSQAPHGALSRRRVLRTCWAHPCGPSPVASRCVHAQNSTAMSQHHSYRRTEGCILPTSGSGAIIAVGSVSHHIQALAENNVRCCRHHHPLERSHGHGVRACVHRAPTLRSRVCCVTRTASSPPTAACLRVRATLSVSARVIPWALRCRRTAGCAPAACVSQAALGPSLERGATSTRQRRAAVRR